MNPQIQKDKSLTFMFENFPHSKVTETMFHGFQNVCESASAQAVEKTCDDYAFGRVEGHNREFLPTLAAFTDRLERTQADLLRQRHRDQRLLDTAPAPPPTEEQKRRVRMLQATFHATKAREISENEGRPIHELQSRGHRRLAKKEYDVRMKDGWPVYAKTGKQVLSDETKAEYKL